MYIKFDKKLKTNGKFIYYDNHKPIDPDLYEFIASLSLDSFGICFELKETTTIHNLYWYSTVADNSSIEWITGTILKDNEDATNLSRCTLIANNSFFGTVTYTEYKLKTIDDKTIYEYKMPVDNITLEPGKYIFKHAISKSYNLGNKTRIYSSNNNDNGKVCSWQGSGSDIVNIGQRCYDWASFNLTDENIMYKID